MTKGKYIRTEEIKKKMSESRKGIILWNKGLTKETDKRVRKSGEKISIANKGHVSWNKGLTKETDERIKSSWNKGLTKETDERVRKLSEIRKSLYTGENAPMYGRKFSDEHKKRIGDANRNKIISDETRKKISDGNRGKKRSEEFKRNISEKMKGKNNPNYGKFGKEHPKYGIHLSEEHKKIISESKKGKKWTEEHLKNYKKAIKGKRSGKNNPMYGVHRYGEKAPMFGKHHSEETIKKISGENHYNWNPNREERYFPYGENFYNKNIRNRKWNLQKSRDMLTGTVLDPNKKPAYHHIDYDKSNDDPDNICFVSHSNHARITNKQLDPIKSERYKKILQENTLSLKNGEIPKKWSPLNKELFRQEKLKQLDLSSYII